MSSSPTGDRLVTVPAPLVAVALQRGLEQWDAHQVEDLSRALAGCGRQIGSRTEVDLDAVNDTVGGAYAAWLQRVAQADRRFRAALAAGRAAGGYVATRRRLAHAVQVDAKAGRVDLVEELDALVGLPGAGPVLAQVLDRDPDWVRLADEGRPVGIAVTDLGRGMTRVQVSVSAAVDYPLCLGGVRAPAEVQRDFTVEVSHAAWRDRRVRRLRSVTVDVVEVWADPAQLPAPPAPTPATDG